MVGRRVDTGSPLPIPIAAALWSSSTTTTQSDDRHLVVVDLARGQPFPPVAPPPHCKNFFLLSLSSLITTHLFGEIFVLDHFVGAVPEGPE